MSDTGTILDRIAAEYDKLAEAEAAAETTEVVSEEPAPKQGFLKRFAKAFAAKVTQAAKAVQSAFVRLFGDNETEIPQSEGIVRKIARYITAVPKWITLVALKAVQAVIFFVLLMVTAVITVLAMIVGAVLFAAALIVMTVFKLAQGIALIARSPYLLVRGDDCFATDWKGYFLGWAPRYFMTTSIQQAYYMQRLNAETKELVSEQTETEFRPVMEGETTVLMDEVPADTPAKPALTAHTGGKGKATPRRKPKSSPRTKRTELHTLATATAPA